MTVWPAEVWQDLERRFEDMVWRRGEVASFLGPWPGPGQRQLPPWTGQDRQGRWWLPSEVVRWHEHGPRWSQAQVLLWMCTCEEALGVLQRDAGFPLPADLVDVGEPVWLESAVRGWVRDHPDWRELSAGSAVHDMRSAAAVTGLSYETVRKYRSKSRGSWPPPDGWHGLTPRWSEATLRGWLASRGR